MLQFLLASAFLFAGYAMFGVVAFGPLTFRFSSVGQAATTLFAVRMLGGRVPCACVGACACVVCMVRERCNTVPGMSCARHTNVTRVTRLQVMNGDVVRETYQMVLVNEQRWWMRALSQLYLYSFVFAFVYVGTTFCSSRSRVGGSMAGRARVPL